MKNYIFKKVFLIFALISFSVFLSSCAESVSQQPQNVLTNASTVSKQDDLKEIYSDDNVNVMFVKKYDFTQLQGMFSFDLKAENKRDEEISIFLQDAYINGFSVPIGSGIPLTLSSGKSGANSYFGKYEGTGITTADEIKKIGFKICIMDTSSNVLKTTEAIEITF